MKSFLPIIIFVLIVIAVIAIGAGMNKDKKDSTSPAQDQTSEGNSASSESAKAIVSEEDTKIDKVALAKYLTEKGAKLYGAYWCPHCKDQKATFSDAFQYIDYYECDPKGENARADQCTAANIEGYPTWIINGKEEGGAKSLSELAKLIGFNY